MRTKSLLLLFISFCCCATLAKGQSMHEEIQQVYNFSPHKLSKEEQSKKADRMDEFWNKVKKDTTAYLNQLRVELADSTNPTFFFYDGSHLLLSASQSFKDYPLALTAMLRADLADIDGSDYVRTMNFFAHEGFNTTTAGLKIIAEKKFSAFIPQHALSLDKGLALRFVLLPLASDLYLNQVIQRLEKTQDVADTKYMLNFLAYTCTCEADAAIRKIAEDPARSKEIQKYAAGLLVLHGKKQRNNPDTYQQLVLKRREILSRVSDEALEELNELTRQLKQQYTCH